MSYSIGSLFDGSGGFPLVATLCGIEPKWASEIEPYPIAVTRSRFPNMEHLGDVSKINGGEIEPVDIISFGSPCQDLSISGKRAGLKHESIGDDETTRSGLFMEAIRIIKEMREATNGEYPKVALWENVPGAFSSNKGLDFRTVLEEFIKIKEPEAIMPAVPKGGWPYADCYIGDGWSLGYRVLNAQYWGVPQRRRRIYLVFDFRGECAREILFERTGLRGDFGPGRKERESTAPTSGGSTETGYRDREGAYTLKIRSGCEGGGKGALIQTELSSTLSTNNDQTLFQPITFEPGIAQREGGHIYSGVSGTLRANAGDNQMAVAYGTQEVCRISNGQGHISSDTKKEMCQTLNCMHDSMAIYIVNTIGGQAESAQITDVCPTLKATHYKTPPVIASAGFKPSQGSKAGSISWEKDPPLVSFDGSRYIVRRLTPTEFARLQGFPDLWGHPQTADNFTDAEYNFWLNVRNTYATINGKTVKAYTKEQMVKWYNKLHTDSSEYKMWGNGIALPTALYVMEGIADALKTTDYKEEPENDLCTVADKL